MRKTFTWVATLLMLVACLNNPVVSRTTPYPPEGQDSDHPWGGEQNRDGESTVPLITATGIPSIDIMNRHVIKWFNRDLEKKRARPRVKRDTLKTTPTETPNASTSNAAE